MNHCIPPRALILMAVLFLAVSVDANLRVSTTHDYVEPGKTKRVALKCHFDDGDCHAFGEVYQIALYRGIRSGQSINWKREFVLQSKVLTSVWKQQIQSMTMKARIGGHRRRAFIYLNWDTADEGTVGSYKCGVVGYSDSHGAMSIVSPPVTINGPAPGSPDWFSESRSKTVG